MGRDGVAGTVAVTVLVGVGQDLGDVELRVAELRRGAHLYLPRTTRP